MGAKTGQLRQKKKPKSQPLGWDSWNEQRNALGWVTKKWRRAERTLEETPIKLASERVNN